jgi:hypothetical protein
MYKGCAAYSPAVQTVYPVPFCIKSVCPWLIGGKFDGRICQDAQNGRHPRWTCGLGHAVWPLDARGSCSASTWMT